MRAARLIAHVFDDVYAGRGQHRAAHIARLLERRGRRPKRLGPVFALRVKQKARILYILMRGICLLYTSLSETAEGTKLIIVDENSENDEYAEIFTVYQGYFIGLLLEPAGDVQVSQEELDLAVQFLSDMQFVHTEA